MPDQTQSQDKVTNFKHFQDPANGKWAVIDSNTGDRIVNAGDPVMFDNEQSLLKEYPSSILTNYESVAGQTSQATA